MLARHLQKRKLIACEDSLKPFADGCLLFLGCLSFALLRPRTNSMMFIYGGQSFCYVLLSSLIGMSISPKNTLLEKWRLNIEQCLDIGPTRSKYNSVCVCV